MELICFGFSFIIPPLTLTLTLSIYMIDRDETKALLSERDSLFAKLLDFQRLTSEEVFYPGINPLQAASQL